MKRLIFLVVQRLAFGILTLTGISILVFSAVDLLPGDFATSVLGQAATPETVAAFRRDVGLDRPVAQRYMDWISGVLGGDFGHSYAGASSSDAPARQVTALIAPRFANTLFLAGLTALVAVPAALFVGMVCALRRGSIFDRTINVLGITVISLPEFFVAYVLILIFAVRTPIFHSLAVVNPDMTILERTARCALPAMTLVLVVTAHMMRMTRAAIVNVLSAPYVEMAHLKGLSLSHTIYRHVLPNAWAPIVTVVALNLAYLTVGIVVVEVVFVYPGIGQLMVDAVFARDVPIVQACALIFAAVYTSLNLVADVVMIVSNPRLLHG